MAIGDCVLTQIGIYDISGAELKTAVDSVNLGTSDSSGARLVMIPSSNGLQCYVGKVEVTGW